MLDSMLYSQPWVILKLKKETYGVATSYVKTMVAMPPVVSLPHKPNWCRGVVTLRDHVIPLMDLRSRLGMDSFLDGIHELVDLMNQREQDHQNWLRELESSILENREFTLATDPHKCKFGQWFDSYKPRSFSESQFLRKFVDPHQRIHSIAHRAHELRKQHKQDEALELIRQTHDGELAEMIRLFEQFRVMVKEQCKMEIALVLEKSQKKIAIAVDSIESVEMIEENSVEELAELVRQREHNLAPFVAKRKKTGEVLYLLNALAIIDQNFDI